MDRLNQLRAGAEAGAGRGGDATLDTSSPPSEAYVSANESSKYFSLSDSTFDISPIKDVSLASAASNEPDRDELMPNLSPISKKDVLESFKIGTQIEAANILSGGVDIFDDNDNSFDGDELVIDDNVDMDEKSNLDKESTLDETVSEAPLVDCPLDVASKDTEVVLQIDGKNVDAIDIGNGLYLYRKAGQEELAAVQIITEDNQQEPSFKFLKVRENVEGNLEVYEEFEIEISKDPVNEVNPSVKSTSHVPIKEISKVTNDSSSNKVAEKKDKTPPKEVTPTSIAVVETEVKEPEATELNLNGKMMKFTESRKSPVVGSFTPMTYHSTPNKEGKPLTKTMVDQQLHPSRHSDNVKKTIEVHTDSQKKLATDDIKPKSENLAKKNVADNHGTQEILIENEIEVTIEESENQNKIDLTKDNSVIGTSSNTDKKVVNEELNNDGKKSTDNQNKTNVDDATNKLKEDTVEPTKLMIDNKTQEKVAGSSKTGEIEKKVFGKKENDDIFPTFEDHKNPDLLSNNMICASLLGATKVNQILQSNTENLLGSSVGSSILDTGNKDSNTVSAKDNEKSSSRKDGSKPVVESTKPKSKTVDQVVENAKEIKEHEQYEAKTCEKVPEVAISSRIDLLSTNENKEATKQNVIIPLKESSAAVNEASGNLLTQTQKSLQSIEVLKDTKASNIQLVDEKKNPAASIIPTIKSPPITMKDTEKKEVEVTDELKKTVLETVSEAETTNKIVKASERDTKMRAETIKPSVLKNEPYESKHSFLKETKMNAISQTKKSDLVENIIDPKVVSKLDDKLNPVYKGTEFKTVSKIEMFNPIAKMSEAKTTLQTDDKINQVAKLIIPTTASKTVNKPDSEVETAKYVLSAEKNIEIKPAFQPNKFIPVPKGIKFKIISKSGGLNPIEKKIDQSPVINTNDKISVVKLNEIKTYSKTDMLNLTVKGIESKTVPKIDQALPITEGIELKTVPKTVLLNPVSKGIEPKISNVVKPDPVAYQIPKNKAIIITSNKIIVPSKVESLPKETNVHQESSNSDTKPINNNHTAVPFGKWTDANRQEFLNKFKDIKIPATSNTKQIKNSNDLNRIDVLKKIDSQRSNTASAKAQDKSNVKDTVFSNKISPPKIEMKQPVKNEGLKVKPKPVDTKNNLKPESTTETVSSTIGSVITSDVANPKSEERREVNFSDLIGKAIVEMLNRPVPMPMTKSPLDEPSQGDRDDHVTQTEASADPQNRNIDQQKLKSDQHKINIDQQKLKNDQQKQIIDQQKLNNEQKIDEDSSGSLDDIEMKMNELHGIPFVERPLHELPKVHKTYSKSNKDSKQSKGAKKKLPATSKQSLMSQTNVIDLESDEEVIEHEPVTGDINLKKKIESKLPLPVKTHVYDNQTVKETQKKTVITENDFDKFAGKNSITYENCLAVKYDGKEPANVVQSVKEKDDTKNYAKKEIIRIDTNMKLPPKQTTSQVNTSKIPNTKFGAVPEDPNDKNYVSKIHSAYQSALTAKRQMDRPITMIEDKPVKVVFMDTNVEFVPNQLNVQGKELSPAKNVDVESAKANPQPVNDVIDTVEEKQQDDTKTKTKHQRKQVLHPVEAPDLELIQPRDLGLDVSPKKKRKTEVEIENSVKNLVHKKSYLLGRAVPDEKTAPDLTNPIIETITRSDIMLERSAVSAIDSLVKAAELLENQSVQNASPNPDSHQNTPVKRGRGRPRKNPLPEGASFSKVDSPSPQKKLRLIDAKPVKQDPISDEESSDAEQMIRENWTMGKINENIVCPICNKLFRSENVVFKHVKHCTGVSPTRSDLEKLSPRRRRHSKESDNKSESRSDDIEFNETPKSVKSTLKKRKSKESVIKSDEVDIIVIEETPVKDQDTENKPRSSKTSEEKQEKPNTFKANKAADKTEGYPKKMLEAKTDKEPTLKEIADEQLKAKQLEVEEDPGKEKNIEESTEEKPGKATKLQKTSIQRSSNLVCEFCGKAFRQLSYLANHKLQHKKEQLKKLEAKLTAKLQVFSCEVCKKEFRKLHHLVQHKNIHNPEVPTRTTRKSSSEHSDVKVKELPLPKQNDDTSAGFRCEPCDKSFRKLHHLVEHRETHDGINRQKTNQTPAPPIEKPPPPPQCDVCKKVFRKLHHLIEHKEQHHVEQVETSSEKSDDKSVQSSLSTRDIIHECSLCYMVFPNEHSLNKHFVICQQKKKRQSKAKDKLENADGTDTVEENTNTEDSMDAEEAPKIVEEQIIGDNEVESEQKSKNIALPKTIEQKEVSEKASDIEKTTLAEKLTVVTEIPVLKEKQVTEEKRAPVKRDHRKSDSSLNVKTVVPEKIQKIDDQAKAELPKKTSAKDKVPPSVTKRQKSIAPMPTLPEGKPIESSDDDEIRYMLNPNFDETSEGKVFMKVRSNKRNSLQIERPNSRDLVNRRTSLQHPPKIPRLKAKAIEPKVVPTKNAPKAKLQASTESDDNDIKYAFPGTVSEQTPIDESINVKKTLRKSMAEKRKSLSGIAKRKSLGQGIAKLKVNPSPLRIIKRRTLDVEHRCDCGQLFNSAALLTRHTSLAHTPPRIRRRRSPPPETDTNAKQRKSTIDTQPAKTTRKSSVKSEASNSKPTRKSSAKSDTPETRKSTTIAAMEQSQLKKSAAKPRRNAAHRGVPVPEKMRKLMLKNAK